MANKDFLRIIRNWLGVAGVAPKEAKAIQIRGRSFEYGMLFIALWLPVEWYMQSRGMLPAKFYFITNWIIWTAFVAETLVMSISVKHKLFYLTTNWLNLVIIIILLPFLWPPAYIATIVRIIRVGLMFRFLIPWLEFSTSFLSRNHLGTTIFIAIIFTTAAGLIIATFDPGIPDAQTGIWWAWQTITSVGYGDVVPVTLSGRILGTLVMVFSIGLLAVLTANFSAFFIQRGEKAEKRELREIHEVLKRLEEKIDENGKKS